MVIFCYINTNEIPSELSRENVISSHVKRSLLLWLHMKIAPFDAFREVIEYYQIFHSFAALTREIFFNGPREISYLRAAVSSV